MPTKQEGLIVRQSLANLADAATAAMVASAYCSDDLCSKKASLVLCALAGFQSALLYESVVGGVEPVLQRVKTVAPSVY